MAVWIPTLTLLLLLTDRQGVDSPHESFVGREVDCVCRHLPSDGEGQASEESPVAALPDDVNQSLDGSLSIFVNLHLGLDQLHGGANESLEKQK